VTIAKMIELEDGMENIGAEIIKEVADKTNEAVGDGTTTAILLTQAIVNEGLRNVEAGSNSLEIKRGLDKAKDLVVSELKRLSKSIKSQEEIEQIATISSQNENIGKIISEVIKEVGKDGVITIEESNVLGLNSEVVKGLKFNKGYISGYMITNQEKMEAVMENPYILITDKKISSLQEILPLLEKITKSGKKDLVIIADNIDGDALTTLIVNKVRGIINVLAIKAPGFGEEKKEILKDISVVVGGEFISDEVGDKLETATLEMLGRAKKVISTKDSSIIIDGGGKKSDIEKRVYFIKNQLVSETYNKEKLNDRLAKLTGGVGIIKVGASTEVEQKNVFYKLEDALNATKCAIEEGIVVGGGVALLRASEVLNKTKFNGDEEIGKNILYKSLQYPLRQLVINCGMDDGVAVNEVLKGKNNFGFNAQTMVYEDLVKAGIIDPTKVTRTALENAVSASGILLTTEVLISNINVQGEKIRQDI
jgi:chaperonin GroEL